MTLDTMTSVTPAPRWERLKPVLPRKRDVRRLEALIGNHTTSLALRFRALGTPDTPPRGARAAHIAGVYEAWYYAWRAVRDALWIGDGGGVGGGTRGRRSTLVKLLGWARDRAAEPAREPCDDIFDPDSAWYVKNITREEWKVKKAGVRAGYAAVARVLARLLQDE